MIDFYLLWLDFIFYLKTVYCSMCSTETCCHCGVASARCARGLCLRIFGPPMKQQSLNTLILQLSGFLNYFIYL